MTVHVVFCLLRKICQYHAVAASCHSCTYSCYLQMLTSVRPPQSLHRVTRALCRCIHGALLPGWCLSVYAMWTASAANGCEWQPLALHTYVQANTMNKRHCMLDWHSTAHAEKQNSTSTQAGHWKAWQI